MWGLIVGGCGSFEMVDTAELVEGAGMICWGGWVDIYSVVEE